LLPGGATVAQLADIAEGTSDDQVRTQLKANHPGWTPEAIELHLSQLKKASAYLAAYPSEFRALETFGAATVLATAASEEDGKLTSLADFHEVYKTEIQEIITAHPDGPPSFNESAEENQTLGAQNPALWRLGNFGQPNSHQPLAYEEVVKRKFDKIDGGIQGADDGSLGWSEMADVREQALQNKQYDLYFSLDYVMRHGATLFPGQGEGETLKLNHDVLNQRITTDQNERAAAMTLLESGFSEDDAVKYAPSMTPEEFESEDFRNFLGRSIANGVSAPLALLRARYSKYEYKSDSDTYPITDPGAIAQASEREMSDEAFLEHWATLPPNTMDERDSLQKTRAWSIFEFFDARKKESTSDYGLEYEPVFDEILKENLTGSEADNLFKLTANSIAYIKAEINSADPVIGAAFSLKNISNLSAEAIKELAGQLNSASIAANSKHYTGEVEDPVIFYADTIKKLILENKITDPSSEFYTLAVDKLKSAAGVDSGTNADLATESMKDLVGNLTLLDVIMPKSDKFLDVLERYKEALDAPVSKGEQLGSGEELHLNECLVSSNGQYELVMQNDGNLVLYRYGSTKDDRWSIWDSGTVNKGVTHAKLKSDGHLVLFADETSIVDIGTSGGARLLVQNDGNLVSYDVDNARWVLVQVAFENEVWRVEGAPG
jgi:hypothetical protein